MGANMFMDAGALRDTSAPGVMSAVSGLIAAATAGGSDVFAFRNVKQLDTPGNLTRPVGVSAVRCNILGGVTAYSAAASLAIAFYKATGFTVFASGGTAVTAQRRNAGDAIPATELDGRIATTGALTAGTRTLASQPFFVASFGGSTTFGGSSELWVPEDAMPWVLTGDEGIVAQLLEAAPAGGTARVFVSVDFFRFGG